MSGLEEDPQDASEVQDEDARKETTGTAEIGKPEELTNSIEESDSSPESSESSSTVGSEEERREVREEERTEEERRETTPSRVETGKENTPEPAELAAATSSASSTTTTTSNDGVPVPMTGYAAGQPRQAGPGETKKGAPTVIAGRNSDGDNGRGHVGAGVGEWNSLPVLVERLREALELSLAAGCWRSDEPTGDVVAVSEVGSGDRQRGRRSMELALLGGFDHGEPAPKREELKFLEDLLLSDIQTALARLRETLERTDVATLAKHGGVSDPTSKLHLLRLVSSLLSRLQVPREEEEGSSTLDGDESEATTTSPRTVGASPVIGRRRRPVRHTIGVSAEEIAHARRQLEESNASLTRLREEALCARRQQVEVPLAAASSNAPNNGGERLVEEIHDKCTKDAINQRQSLRDKNKDSSVVYRSAPVAVHADRGPVAQPPAIVESDHAYQGKRLCNVDDYQEKEKVNDDEEAAVRRANEEQSRVNKLAAALRQRATELANAKCEQENNIIFNNNNKFTARKSRIKRANTVDIPSYLKAGGLGYEKAGCAFLRRPIHVGDKIASCATNNNVAVPSFHPRTENDKKFLALISRNNETQTTLNAAPVFKSFGYTKATDMSSLTNENWNSRFSNIKTTFDKPAPPASEAENKLSPKPRPAKRFPPVASPAQPTNRTASTGISAAHNSPFPFANANVSRPTDAGFKHAPSSPFRRIEKPPKSPPGYQQRQRDNAPPPGNTLREKARIMFDRDGGAPPPQSQTAAFRFKLDARENASRKSSFPRPPWIEHERNESRACGTIAENGRLDYRLFCKQFAPFVGKSASSPETKRPQITEAPRKLLSELPRLQREDPAAPADNERHGVVDGRLTFRMFPETIGSQQCRASETPVGVSDGLPVGDKLDPYIEKNIFESTCERGSDYDGTATSGVNATGRKTGSSVPTTASSDDRACDRESRAPRTSPVVSEDNGASVQTYRQPQHPANYAEPRERRLASRSYERSESNPTTISDSGCRGPEETRHHVPDRNQNHQAATSIDVASARSAELPRSTNPTESASLSATSGYRSPERRERFPQAQPRYENYPPANSTADERSQAYRSYSPRARSSGDPFEYPSPGTSRETDKGDFSLTNDSGVGGCGLPEEENIQNQDISADAGVVTRYTCAIATVASSADVIPMSPSDSAAEAVTFSLPSLSQFVSRPKPISDDETTATEDEIRRHNMLQQSLVRRLQNERATLNEPPASGFDQPARFQPHDAPRRPEPPRRAVPPPKRAEPPPKRAEPPRKSEAPKKLEPARRLQPPIVTGLLSVAPSAGSGAVNRVTALREQYEQPAGQSRLVQKERSPIPNGTNSAMDSSDEYLVSCSNRPSRSIVLSKSESWHQLALSNSHHHQQQQQQQHHPHPHHHHHHHHSSRTSQSNLLPSSSSYTSASSYLPKPPKPKSPLPFRTRKQYEASTDSVRKMEDKIRRYFDSPNDSADAKDAKSKRFPPRDSTAKGLIGLSRSRTAPGLCGDERLRLSIPTQVPAMSLNSADVDKVFDDIFEEATRTDDHCF